MIRYNNPVPFYNDDVGHTMSGAKLYFYENVTTTPKATFANSDLTIQNPHPIVADGAGRFSDIWLDGTIYTVELRDSFDVTIFTRDEVGNEIAAAASYGVITFNTISDMQNGITSTGLNYTPVLGQALRTFNRNNVIDGVGGLYKVVPPATGLPSNNAEYINLSNGMQAELVEIEDKTVRQLTDSTTETFIFGAFPCTSYLPVNLTADMNLTLSETQIPIGYAKVVRSKSSLNFVINVIDEFTGNTLASLATGEWAEFQTSDISNNVWIQTGGGTLP